MVWLDIFVEYIWILTLFDVLQDGECMGDGQPGGQNARPGFLSKFAKFATRRLVRLHMQLKLWDYLSEHYCRKVSWFLQTLIQLKQKTSKMSLSLNNAPSEDWAQFSILCYLWLSWYFGHGGGVSNLVNLFGGLTTWNISCCPIAHEHNTGSRPRHDPH